MFNGIIDIVFLTVLAAVILMRLHKSLGSVDEETKERVLKQQQTLQDLQQMVKKDEEVSSVQLSGLLARDEIAKLELHPDIEAGLLKIAEKDKSFSPGAFLEGADIAFEMVLQAFAQGDSKQLKSLLAKEVYKSFESAIHERMEKGQTMETTLVAILEHSITQAECVKQQARITVNFKTEQVILLKDKEGELIDSDPSHIEILEDSWTFARNVNSRNPNWHVIAINDQD